MTVKLNMIFEDNNAPDFGSIKLTDTNQFCRNEYVLFESDTDKLSTNLTKTVCGEAFNVGSGSIAFVLDGEQDVYRYHSDTDRWYKVV